MKADGKGCCTCPTHGRRPLPAHYEPYESPVENVVYPKQQRNPVALNWEPESNLAPVGSRYPHVLRVSADGSTT